MVELTGIEPVTSRLRTVRSSQLSYSPVSFILLWDGPAWRGNLPDVHRDALASAKG